MRVTRDSKSYAKKALRYLEKFPEHHNQANWIDGVLGDVTQPVHCGTTMCVGGTVNWLKNGKRADIENSDSVAREALGLSFGEADVLFYEMDEKRALAKLRKIANGEPFTEADYHKQSERGEDNEPYFDSNSWDMRDEYDDE